MDIVSLLILIGIVTSIVSSFKESAKKADEKVREKRNASIGSILNKIPLEKLEPYVGEDVVNEFKGYVGYKEKDKVKNKKHIKNEIDKNIYVEDSPIKNTKKKKPTKKAERLYTTEKTIEVNHFSMDIKKKPKKKNPFEFTENPVTNAIIAAEILGKPKCKK